MRLPVTAAPTLLTQLRLGGLWLLSAPAWSSAGVGTGYEIPWLFWEPLGAGRGWGRGLGLEAEPPEALPCLGRGAQAGGGGMYAPG